MSIITHKRYLALALPFIISTVTQPLLGAVDTAVVGRLGHPSHIGGVAIGTVIFNTLYWLFGFLRVSTSGYSAQSLGSGNPKEMYHAYFRPLIIALVISLWFIFCQGPIIRAAIHIYNPVPDVAVHVTTYFRVLIWGAPLVLVNYVNLGWLMGRGQVKETLFLQVSANALNIVLDLIFVSVLNKGVAGVAWGTLISQGYAFLMGTGLLSVRLDFLGIRHHWPGVMTPSAVKKSMAVNGDLLIRTVCLLSMTNLFVAKGSELGPSFLAANAVLFQVQYIVAYFFDGLANAAGVFAGEALGRKSLEDFRRTRKISDFYLTGTGAAAAGSICVFRRQIIQCFTNLEEVVVLCQDYMVWLTLFPLTVGAGLVYYGLYTGTTHTAPVRNSMLISLGVFAAAYYTMVPMFHNHGLWLSFILFSQCRSTVLFMGIKGMEQKLFIGGERPWRT